MRNDLRRTVGTAIAVATTLGLGCGHSAATRSASMASAPPRPTAVQSPPMASAPVVTSDTLTAGSTRLDDASTTQLVKDAFVYAYPYVLMDVTREEMTTAAGAAHAPPNQIAHVREIPSPNVHDVVRPNFDTLYSSAWLDLSQGPIVLTVPDTHGRYYVWQLMDAATNVFSSVGKRTTGTKRGAFAIVGPGFAGALPEGVQRIDAPTNTVWAVGRTLVKGRNDIAAVHRIQDQYRLTPLVDFVARTEPAAAPMPSGSPSAESPMRRVDSMRADEFFTRFANVLAKNPPPAADQAFLARLAPIGITPGQPFDARALSARPAAAARGVTEARASILAGDHAAVTQHDGWILYGLRGEAMGAYGTDYATRATIARTALGANLPADAIYPIAKVDAQGAALDGTKRYRIHFAADALPPVDQFWSLTAYDADGYVVENARGRYAIGDRNRLRRNSDGSIDVYLASESPGRALEANWLPIPAGVFDVTLRLYGPRPQALEGRWLPPAIERMD